MAAGGQSNENKEELTFGRLLKTLRTQKGLDLKTISEETRIAVSTLRLLEEETYDKLPDNVFVKGFLRSYAKLLDTSPDAVIQNFLAGRHHYNEALRFESGLAKGRRSFRLPGALAVGFLACILFAGILVLKPHTGRESTGTATRQVETPVPAGIDTLSETDEQQTTGTPEPDTTYLLQISAVEETWLKIIVDRQDPKEYHLNPGDRLELKATSGFNLLIGNATGINLQLNHRAIAIEGSHGQVVTLKLPR